MPTSAREKLQISDTSDCIGKVLKSPTKNASASAEALFTIGSVSRVLSSTVIYLGAPLPVRSSHLLGSSRASLASSAVLLRIEFTAMDAFARHWVRSYRTFPPLPRRRKLHIPRPAASGRSRSFRCASSPHKTFVLRGPHSWAAAVYLCCTFPQIALGGRYPLSLPCGARTFLMRGLSALRPRLSDPVAHVLYFICRKKSNGLQFLSRADIIQAGNFKRGF